MDKELQKLIDSISYEDCVHFICPKWNKKAETNILNGAETINNIVDEFIRQQMEYKERVLAKIITTYDFVVGSIECKHRLMEILPEGATIVCSPYIEDPTIIYAIKKFDVKDLLNEPIWAEKEKKE